MECPKCKSTQTKKNGTQIKSGKRAQLYECLTCGHAWRGYEKKDTILRRVIIISDTHCGHITGLTPPEYNDKSKKYNEFRTESWNWFNNVIERMKPFDYAIFNGDMIDGKQVKSGGLELLTPDRIEQVRMATLIAQKINAVKNIVIRGSKYHVGKEENFEDDFADRINAKIYNRFLGDICGKVFDIRHKIGRSAIPHGRVAPLSRQVLWSRLREERSGVHADVIVRSHVHYHVSIEENKVIALTTPALQGASDYGELECDGEVDYGLLIFDIYADGHMIKHTFLPKFESSQIKIEEI